MGDRVQALMERMIPELEDLQEKKILDKVRPGRMHSNKAGTSVLSFDGQTLGLGYLYVRPLNFQMC